MLKVEETLHDYHLARVVESARAILNHAKNVFRSLESAGRTSDGVPQFVESNLNQKRDHAEEPIQPRCACCDVHVSTPCWVCVICSK